MKAANLFNILTTAVLLILLGAPTLFAAPGDNDENPILITDLAGLQAMENGLDKHYRLANDIDASATVDWNVGNHDQNSATPDEAMGFEPVGNVNALFTGSLNGDGHSINNLTINRPGYGEIGLIGYADGAEIKNLAMANGTISGAWRVGGIAGILIESSVIMQCYVTGSVRGNQELGGIAGTVFSSSSIIDCCFSGSVIEVIVNNGYIGGIAGLSSQSDLSNSYVTGVVSGATTSCGAVVGQNHDGTVTSCYWDTETTGSSAGIGVDNNSQTAEGKTSAQLKQAATFIGWDFASTWSIEEDMRSPWLSFNTQASFSVIYTAGDNGGITGEASQTVSAGADTTAVTAVPDIGCLFTQWSDGRTDNPRIDYNVASDLSYTASFVIGFPQGDGSEADPYLITSLALLQKMQENLGAYYRLGNDIDASATVDWNVGDHDNNSATEDEAMGFAPVGDDSNYFTGGLDGDGYSISGFVINRPGYDSIGLIGRTEGAEIKALSMVDGAVSGDLGVGGIVGLLLAGSTVTDCATTGSVTGVKGVGGIVGAMMSSVVSGCSATGEISISGAGSEYVGGIVGWAETDYSDSLVENCSFSGTVDARIGDGDGVGGIIGYAACCVVRNCSSTGSVTGLNRSKVGGIVGKGGYDMTMEQCFATGTVKGKEKTGGIIGELSDSSIITDCWFTGAVYGVTDTGGIAGNVFVTSSLSNSYVTGTVNGSERTGGIAGTLSWVAHLDESSITDCYFTGAVYGVTDTGGIVGVTNNTAILSNSYVTGVVSGDTNRGAVVGRNDLGNLTSCYWDTETTGSSAGIGLDNNSQTAEGKTSAQLKQAATFIGWDFASTWSIEEDMRYPWLSFNTHGPYSVTYTADNDATDNGTIEGETPQTVSTGADTTAVTAVADEVGYALSHWSDGRTDNPRVDYNVASDLSYTASFAIGYAQGDGSEAAPYMITTLALLQKMEDNLGAHYRLANDIDASATVDWNVGDHDNDPATPDEAMGFAPVGELDKRFTGGLDGDGYSISGLVVNRDVSNVGLIGYADRSIITSLRMVGGSIRGLARVGGIMGRGSYSTLTNCSTSGTVNGLHTVGGVVGALTDSTITDCSASGAVSGRQEDGGYVGGVSGTQYDTKNTNCFASGAVSGSRSGVGGYTGQMVNGTMDNCYATGKVTGAGYGAGGLVGNLESSGTIISNCYSTGEVSGEYYVGGFIGEDNTVAGVITACFWDTTSSKTTTGFGDSPPSGSVDLTGLPTPEMKTQATFTDAGWDFSDESANGTDDHWCMDNGEEYPLLRWSAARLEYNTDNYGTLNPGDDPLQYVFKGENGSPVTAVPDTNYSFVRWSDGGQTANRIDTDVSADITVTAEFAMETHSLNYSAGTGGTISGIAQQTVAHQGDGFAVTAVADLDYNFVRWSDGVQTAERVDTNISADLSVTAEFAMEIHSLSYSGGDHGSISGIAQQTVAHGGDGLAVTAVADSGYAFVRWNDGQTENPRTDANVLADLSLTAEYTPTYSLSYLAGIGGTISGIAQQSVVAGEDGSPVTAEPDTGYSFIRWSDGQTENPRTDTNVLADLNVTAEFVEGYILSYSAGTGGAISGIAQQVVVAGEDGLPVTAEPDTGYSFVRWSDGVTENPRTDLAVSVSISVTAEFKKDSSFLLFIVPAIIGAIQDK